MKRSIIATALLFFTGTAFGKDVPVPPTDYRLFNIPADRGQEKLCTALTDAQELKARLSALGVQKPEVILGKIAPPIDWQTSGVLLLYQPDPPPDVVPTVRSLLRDVNREKFTILFRYIDPNQPPSQEGNKVASAGGFSLKAVTVGTDDTRNRTGARSPLLLVKIGRAHV